MTIEKKHNRVIKFRAWDGSKMIFPSVIGINLEDFAWGHLRSWLHNCQEWDGKDGFIDEPVLQQFTGLLDKNGKEIYEGDIVKDSELTYIVRFGECTSVPIEFCGWYLEHLERTDYNGPFTSFDQKVVEVIGNIYQDKHLLE